VEAAKTATNFLQMSGGRTANIFAILVQMMPSGRAGHMAHGVHTTDLPWKNREKRGNRENRRKPPKMGPCPAYPQNQC